MEKGTLFSWIWSSCSYNTLTSTSLPVCSWNIAAYSLISFSRPFLAASMRTRSGTVVSKKESDTWSIIALRSWEEEKKCLLFMRKSSCYFLVRIAVVLKFHFTHFLSSPDNHNMWHSVWTPFTSKISKIFRIKNETAVSLLLPKATHFFYHTLFST